MISIDQLRQAVETLFSLNPPKKQLTTEFIANCIKEYLQLTDAPALSDVITALRQVEHCVPRPMLRQKGKLIPEIRWVFVAAPKAKPEKKAKARNYTDKPIAKSLRLKMA